MHAAPFPWLDQLNGRVRWIGVGNAEQQDDAAGLVLAQRLQAIGEPEVALGELQPERHVTSADLVGVDHVVLLDAVDLGAAPGCVIFLSAEAMNARLPSVSTHRIPLPLLARWVETHAPTRAWLLGIQPAKIGTGVGLSPEVQRTIDLLVVLRARRLRACPARSVGCPAGVRPGALVAS